MKKSKGMQLGAMLAAVLMVGIVFVPAVSAAGTSNLSDPATVKALIDKLSNEGNNASKAFEKLSPQEQAAVVEALKVKEIKINTSEEGVSVATITCNSPRVELDGYGAIGKVWAYFQQIDRCYDGSKLTEVTRTRWGEVYYPFWTFAGHIGNTESGGVGQSSYRAWTQGQFKYCISSYGCIQEKDPWIDQIVYGNGNYWWNYGGL